MGRRRWVTAAVAFGAVLPLTLGVAPAVAAKAAAVPYDFNGNGRPELVVGAPGLQVNGHRAAGGVVVVQPTSRSKPRAGDARLFTQSTSKVAGASEYNDSFGGAVASGDFDRDGYADLAVGLPNEDFSGTHYAGAVTILYGSAKGLSGRRSVQLSEPSGKHLRAFFGASLAAADLDGDGYADLAVGAPGDVPEEAPGPAFSRGTVTVFHGGTKGISGSANTLLRGVRGTPEPDTSFGSNLAVADVDADGRSDLVVLSGGDEDSDDTGLPGSLSFCAGGGKGAPSGCRRLVRSDDLRGADALVVGNLTGDSRPEIVAGGGYDGLDPGHLELATLTGTDGRTSASLRVIDDHDLGVAPVEAFGEALAVGDFGGDDHADLVVGAPAASETGEPVGGQVYLVHGGTAGLDLKGTQTIDQDIPGVPGSSESEDDFGAALTVIDRNGDGTPDLVVGNPDEDGTGRVVTLLGTGSSVTTQGAGTFGMSDLGLGKPKSAEFGAVLGR